MHKVLLWGDEGSGKSTIAALLARYAVAGGAAVLIVDAGGEPAMHRLLGLPRPKMTLVEDMGGAEYVRRSYPCDRCGSLIPDLPVDSLPSTCMSRRDNLALLSLGVEFLGEVGGFSLGLLFREFLGRLDDTGWWIFIDGGSWLEDSGEVSLGVIDGVLEVHSPGGGVGVTNDTEVGGLFERYGLPRFSVLNRVTSPETMDDSVARTWFPEEGSAFSIPPDGKGMPFPPDFLIPLRGLWETLMSNFGSPRSSRIGFGGGSAFRS